jgi:hypothetical protein
MTFEREADCRAALETRQTEDGKWQVGRNTGETVRWMCGEYVSDKAARNAGVRRLYGKA